MATDDYATAAMSDKLQSNLRRIEGLNQRLLTAISRRETRDPGLEGPTPQLFMAAAQALQSEAMSNPARLLEVQASWWGETFKHYLEAQQAFAQGTAPPPAATPKGTDRRFSNPLWDSHPYFSFLKQQYLRNADTLRGALGDLQPLTATDRRRVEYFTQQLIDMMAPTNFFGTNPDALERAMATEGESLVQGLENLVQDLEANDGELLVTLSDPSAFTLGQNIGASAGQVVFRNRIMELIQFSPTTEKVHRTPLLVFPPWINKFYIMDLKPQNSLIKWIVDQGFTLFVVSWKNPDASYADFGMDDYIREGYLEAIEAVKSITGEAKINAVGYCIAGTTLSITLSLLAKRKDSSIKSATFFTMLSDFADQGDFTPFLTDDFVDSIDRECQAKGYLASTILARTFSFLRPNELIYQPAIRSYMMGERPPAFDLLHWNGDGTNLPGKMCVEYLRLLCQQNLFAQGCYKVMGETLGPKAVTLPIWAVGCETDHIAAWRQSYRGLRRFGSKDKTFIMSQSGHVAGIINPPTKDKYGHYRNAAPIEGLDDDQWLAGASFQKGSWWPAWGEWLAKRSGAKVAARHPGTSPDFPALAPAPGTYVVNG